MARASRQPELLELTHFPDSNGLLVVTAQGESPLAVRRVFTVHADAGAHRGEHAHRSCSQLLVALAGSTRVLTFDGVRSSTFELNRPTQGLLVPPWTWSAQHSLQDESILMVVCDEPYDEADYIRDMSEFQQLVQSGGSLQ